MIDIEEIKKLSVDQRIQLVQDVWDSIDEDAIGLNLTPAQKIELNRRVEKYERGEGKLYSWEEFKQRIGLR